MPTPRTRFSPTRAMGIPSMQDESFLSQPSFTPDRGYSASPLMVTQVDPFEEEMRKLETQKALAQVQDQEELMSGRFDPLSPAGRQKRLNMLLRGTITAPQEYAMQRMEPKPIKPPSINKYSPVPADVVQAASEFDFLDPTDEKAWDKRVEILRALDAHPEFARSNVKSHPYFQQKDQALLRDILASKTHRETYSRKQQEKTRLGATETKLLQDVAKNIYDPLDMSKSVEDRQALAMIVEDLLADGRDVPERYIRMANLPVEHASSAPPQSKVSQPVRPQGVVMNNQNVPRASSIPTVNTPAELRALGLPKGAQFMTPDGKIGTVK